MKHLKHSHIKLTLRETFVDDLPYDNKLCIPSTVFYVMPHDRNIFEICKK